MLEEAAQELPLRARAAAVAATREALGPLSVRAVEIGIEAPSGARLRRALANGRPLGKFPNDEAGARGHKASANRAISATKRFRERETQPNRPSWLASHVIAASARPR